MHQMERFSALQKFRFTNLVCSSYNLPMRHFSIGLLAAFSVVVYAQPAAPTASNSNAIDQTKNGFPLPTDLPVSANVTAQAVLLPPKVVERIFGKEIALSYAVIEVNVANKSRDAAFILHGLFLDYREWALSGYIQR